MFGSDVRVRFRSVCCDESREPEEYRAEGQPIHLIGVEFSRESHNLVGFEVE